MIENEYKDIKSDKVKIYNHRKYAFLNDEEEIIVIRMSFDKERIFIRSVHRIEYVTGLDGEPKMNYISMDINLSNTSSEKHQLLGMEMLNESI